MNTNKVKKIKRKEIAYLKEIIQIKKTTKIY